MPDIPLIAGPVSAGELVGILNALIIKFNNRTGDYRFFQDDDGALKIKKPDGSTVTLVEGP